MTDHDAGELKLLPCPWPHCPGTGQVEREETSFSGEKVVGVDEDNGPIYWVECNLCMCRGPLASWAVDAIELWNTRPSPGAAVVTVSDEMVESASEAYLQVVDQFSKKQINHMSAQLLNARHKAAMRAALLAALTPPAGKEGI